MQAIILAAGMGKRLGELTHHNTKCMIKVGEKTLIERLLSQLDKFGLDRIVIVTGYKGENLQSFVRTLSIDTQILFVENPVFDKTNNIYSLYLAKDYLKTDDTLLFESDIIVEDAVISKLINNEYPDLALVDKFESWMDGTVVTIDKSNRIQRFIPNTQFRYEEIPSYYKTVNIYKFSKGFSSHMYLPFLEAYCQAMGNNEYYEQVLRIITTLDNSGMRALPLNGERWYEIDDIQDLDIAESIFCEKQYDQICSRYGGYWRYPKMLDFCYLVNPYFPNQRLRDELAANFDRLLTEYPSGQRVNDLLAAKNFEVKQEYITVGNGAAELINLLTSQMLGKVGVIKPTFEEYPNRLIPERVVAFQTKAPDFKYGADDLIRYFEDKNIWSLIVVNPDNPTGNYLPYNDILRLSAWCKEKDIIFIVDESFVDFSTEHRTLINNKILEEYTNLVVVKSISKSYGVPGLRLGILATANHMLMTKLRIDMPIWNINSFAEFFMQIIGKYDKAYQYAMEDFRKERNRYIAELKKIKWLRVLPSEANYVLCEISGELEPHTLAEKLLNEENILIKDCSKKCSGKYIRLAVRDTIDNNRLIETLNKL